MHIDEQTYDTPIRIEDSKTTVYVTDATAGSIRDDMNGQAHRWLSGAVTLWDRCDVEDLAQLKEVAYQLGRARDCVDALIGLAPLPDEDVDGS